MEMIDFMNKYSPKVWHEEAGWNVRVKIPETSSFVGGGDFIHVRSVYLTTAVNVTNKVLDAYYEGA